MGRATGRRPPAADPVPRGGTAERNRGVGRAGCGRPGVAVGPRGPAGPRSDPACVVQQRTRSSHPPRSVEGARTVGPELDAPVPHRAVTALRLSATPRGHRHRHRLTQPRAARTAQQPPRPDPFRPEVLHREGGGAEHVPFGTANDGGIQRLPLPRSWMTKATLGDSSDIEPRAPRRTTVRPNSRLPAPPFGSPDTRNGPTACAPGVRHGVEYEVLSWSIIHRW